MSEQTKKCNKCGEVKAKSEFGKKRRNPDGLQYKCKSCRNLAASEYRRNNPEKWAGTKRKYRDRNHQKIKAYSKKYYWSNLNACRARNKRYYESNPEKASHRRSLRRARLLGSIGDHTPEQLKARFDYHGNKCVYCDSTENLHADHQIPLSRGGTNFASNMVPACASCNLSKGSKTPEEFLLQQFNIAMDKLING